MSTRLCRVFGVAWFLLLPVTAAPGAEQEAGRELRVPEIRFDTGASPQACPFDPATAAATPNLVFEYMEGGPEKAVACTELLDESLPRWEERPGAERLLRPFVTYLLGDGTATGLQRHEVFVALLGHLEKISPGWRYSDALKPLLAEMILGSVVEDPFVADFWARTVEEMDENWRESEAASSVLPMLYERALAEAENPAATRNQRPKALLKELSLPGYARLILVTRVFDSRAKRAVSLLLAFGIVALLVARLRRRKRAG